jgi:hypothetical protein
MISLLIFFCILGTLQHGLIFVFESKTTIQTHSLQIEDGCTVGKIGMNKDYLAAMVIPKKGNSKVFIWKRSENYRTLPAIVGHEGLSLKNYLSGFQSFVFSDKSFYIPWFRNSLPHQEEIVYFKWNLER